MIRVDFALIADEWWQAVHAPARIMKKPRLACNRLGSPQRRLILVVSFTGIVATPLGQAWHGFSELCLLRLDF